MKTLKYIILLLSIAHLFYSCYDFSWKDPEPKETIYIPEEDKPYIMYPEGSWWVYRDSVSGALDSFYLEEQVHEMEYDADIDNREYEILNQYFQYVGDIHSFLLYSQEKEMAYSTMYYASYNYCYRNYYNVLFDYISIGDSLKLVGYLKTVNVLPELQLAENNYSDVRYIRQYLVDENTNRTISESFWTKEIGMVKSRRYRHTYDTTTQSFHNDTVFVKELIRYHINN